jgi:hypothetical protein
VNRRFLASQSALAIAAAVALIAPAKAAEPSGLAAVEKAAAALASKNWTPPRTPDGKPDLQGIYNTGNITPFERPAELAEKPFFTPDEAAAFEKRVLTGRNFDRRDGPAAADVARAYNDFWWDFGNNVTRTLQTSIVVDPPNGRMPALTPEAERRTTAIVGAIKKRCETEICTPSNGGSNGVGFGLQRPATAIQDRPYMERCILWPTAGPPMLPSGYNNNYEIVQTPNYVMIYIEMVHDYRIIPLDGRPHLDPNVRQLMGDSRGRWEGSTLVVDTTNFADDTDFHWAGRNMHLVERFTRVAPDAILYEFTVDDPTTFVRPWSGALVMSKTAGPIYEYACHEGNYGMTGVLSGARAAEKNRASQQ